MFCQAVVPEPLGEQMAKILDAAAASQPLKPACKKAHFLSKNRNPCNQKKDDHRGRVGELPLSLMVFITPHRFARFGGNFSVSLIGVSLMMSRAFAHVR